MRHHYLFCKTPFRAVAEWHTYVIEILPFHFAPKEMQSRSVLSAHCVQVLPALPYNRGKSSFGLHRVLWEASSCSTPDNHIPTECILMAIFGVPEQWCSARRWFHYLQSQEHAGFPLVWKHPQGACGIVTHSVQVQHAQLSSGRTCQAAPHSPMCPSPMGNPTVKGRAIP